MMKRDLSISFDVGKKAFYICLIVYLVLYTALNFNLELNNPILWTCYIVTKKFLHLTFLGSRGFLKSKLLCPRPFCERSCYRTSQHLPRFIFQFFIWQLSPNWIIWMFCCQSLDRQLNIRTYVLSMLRTGQTYGLKPTYVYCYSYVH